jgi:hypothetical protein
MGWVIYSFILGWVIAKHDWSDLFSEAPMDCTHAWENNHCYACGVNR